MEQTALRESRPCVLDSLCSICSSSPHEISDFAGTQKKISKSVKIPAVFSLSAKISDANLRTLIESVLKFDAVLRLSLAGQPQTKALITLATDGASKSWND